MWDGGYVMDAACANFVEFARVDGGSGRRPREEASTRSVPAPEKENSLAPTGEGTVVLCPDQIHCGGAPCLGVRGAGVSAAMVPVWQHSGSPSTSDFEPAMSGAGKLNQAVGGATLTGEVKQLIALFEEVDCSIESGIVAEVSNSCCANVVESSDIDKSSRLHN